LVPSFCLQSVRGVPPPGCGSTPAERRCHLSRLSCGGPSQAVRDIESNRIWLNPVESNPCQFNLIQQKK
jgi:hypothetical protein